MAFEVTSSRVIGEVLFTAGSVPDDLRAKSTRMVAEVVGTAADYLGKRAKSTRLVAEVLGMASSKHPGLLVPGISTAGLTVAICFTPELTDVPGYFGLLDADGYGLSWEWTNPAGPVTQRYRLPGVPDVTRPLSGANGIVSVFSSSAGALTLTDLAINRPAGTEGGSTIKELLLFDSPVDPAYADYLEAYLLCRWLSSGCTSPRSPCPA